MKQRIHDTQSLIKACLALVQPQFRLDINHGWHGVGHWARVWRNGLEMCEVMDLSPIVPAAFAFLHDSQRFDEGMDSMHGPRACEWLDRLYHEGKLGPLNLDLRDYKLLTTAIAGHSHGETEAHPIVQVCWDSDRLDLGRVGTMPLAQYLCTPHAKKADTIRRAYNRSIGQPQAS